MKNEEYLVLGLAAVAVYMIVRAGGVNAAFNKFTTLPKNILVNTADRYKTNPTSQQTAMLAEQDAAFLGIDFGSTANTRTPVYSGASGSW